MQDHTGLFAVAEMRDRKVDNTSSGFFEPNTRRAEKAMRDDKSYTYTSLTKKRNV